MTLDPNDSDALEMMIESAAALLPQQAPLHAFVHHNTLHHWEHLPFDQAIEDACRTLGTEGYQSEAAFLAHLEAGRILDRDLSAVVARSEDADIPIFEDGPTYAEFRKARLQNLFEVPSGATLEWHLEEERAASRLPLGLDPKRREEILALGPEKEVLSRLWTAFESVAPHTEEATVGPRWRDQIFDRWGLDTDDQVHPLLIRLSAAFLDQGIAYWTMPERENGFLSCVRQLYALGLATPARWRRDLASELRRQEQEEWSAIKTIDWALREGDVPPSSRSRFIEHSLLALRGWAGMMRHLEERPDRAPVEAPATRLADFLAVRLVFDLFAARAQLRERARMGAPKAVCLGDLLAPRPRPSQQIDRHLVYEAFSLAQRSTVPLDRFEDPTVAKKWLDAVQEFDELQRRRLLHLAYERRHRVELLDALDRDRSAGFAPESPPAFQAIFCIDDREESFRRHLEEIDPSVETFGYAGFFGVAMNYEGLEDVRSRPLCPVVTQPEHRIAEQATSEEEDVAYRRSRRRRAQVSHLTGVGSRTLVRGGILAPLLGPLSILPLVGHALFPTLAHRLGNLLERLSELGLARPRTRLQIEADSTTDVEEAVRSGFRVEEMATIVESALRTMGLDPTRSPLVVVVGHGSSSLNNPHEAAHDCGATGGGRGGPNARAFAAMANHSGVRALLHDRDFAIPDSLWFIGAYHNTCDDSVVFYDTDLVPASCHEALKSARESMRRASVSEAHERVRRFETSPLSVSPAAALRDVQEHSFDLAQPRPEYGHATNAICLVGRRSLTRRLFLDRRAFLVSYDPTADPEGELLAPLLLSVGPVGAGINLEYYFSFVDPIGFGSGTKLPHNITGLIGVMDGHASDLRTGLPWQMVEIHEPVRLLTVVDARKDVLERILSEQAGLRGLISNGWIQFASRDPETGDLFVFEDGGLVPYVPDQKSCPQAKDSQTYYTGHREHLSPAWLGLEDVA